MAALGAAAEDHPETEVADVTTVRATVERAAGDAVPAESVRRFRKSMNW